MTVISSKFKIHSKYDSPELFDYDIMGFHKKRTIIKGELSIIEYYKYYNGIDYSDLIVRETRIYTRNSLGLVLYRTLVSDWYLENGNIGYTKTNIKYYSPQESINEGIIRRENVIDEAKIYVLNTVGQSNAFDLLNTVKSYIELYKDGYKQPLLDSISSIDKSYLTQTIKNNIVSILTF